MLQRANAEKYVRKEDAFRACDWAVFATKKKLGKTIE